MSICIIERDLTTASDLAHILSLRLADYSIIEETTIPISTEILICAVGFVTTIGGNEAIIAMARQAKVKKIFIIHEQAIDAHIEEQMGGRLVHIHIPVSSSNLLSHNYGLQMIASLVCDDRHIALGAETSLKFIQLAQKVAANEVTVLINGPTGTGKEVIAKFIHQHSLRKAHPFIAVNCAAIPENMLEAILFGHEKGAFTGASSANKGIFRAAEDGTLLLDEISEMPLSLQAKLLRVLQEKSVTPIGAHQDIAVNVRVLATTNRQMLEEVKAGRFREDLYYRLNVFPVNTQALCTRPDDIVPIASVLLQRHRKHDGHCAWLDESAIDLLCQHNWPGNVRELENVLQRALVLSDSECITANDIILEPESEQLANLMPMTELQHRLVV